MLNPAEALLTLQNVVLEIHINRLTCDVTIEEANFNADPRNPEIKQLVDAYSGVAVSALSDRQYIETFLQEILQKLVRKHPRCVHRAKTYSS